MEVKFNKEYITNNVEKSSKYIKVAAEYIISEEVCNIKSSTMAGF